MSIKRLFIALSVLILGIYTGMDVLPYRLSAQKPINPKSLSGAYDFSRETGTFLGEPVRSAHVFTDAEIQNVLGATNASKRIEVDLTNQRLYAYENNTKVYDFPVSSGLWGKTPTGEFTIWIKLRYVRMEGGNPAINTYYNLPNVPYTMFFANAEIPTWRGFGIHGTYWHNNFGHPMSHGCINLKTEDAEKLYYWADPQLNGLPSIRASDTNPGTRVIIYGTAPAS